MKTSDIFPGWRRVLQGHRPLLSIEITKECPLRCPGCYVYENGHPGRAGRLPEQPDHKGDSLVDGVLALVRRHRPIHLSIVGGEPLVRYRELDALLPKLDRMGIEVQLVTSAVRPIPAHWASFKCLHLVVSVDGLPPEHDRRRSPATYERVLQHITGHSVIVHCTITRQQLQRSSYLQEFAQFWSDRREARKIWFSLFTPQEGQDGEERLTAADRARAVGELMRVAPSFKKVDMPRAALEGFARPPASPAECMFAQLATCVSADLTTEVTPCQLGGEPVCAECGCLAAVGLASLGRHKLAGLVPVSGLFFLSKRIGEELARRAGRLAQPQPLEAR